MMKKIISIVLSLSMVISICSLPANAWVPTDYDDPRCIDIRKLNQKRYISKNKNVCHCKKCGFDALTYDKLEDYLKYVEQYSDDLAKLPPYFENKIIQQNIWSALKDLANEIEDKSYQRRNFILVSKNNSPRDQGSVAQFARTEGLTYDEMVYGESFFNNINENTIKPLISKVEQNLSIYENQPFKRKRDLSDLVATGILGTFVVVDLGLFAFSIGEPIYQFIKSKYIAKINNRKLDQLINLIDLMSETDKEILKKKINKLLGKSVELNKESLKQLPTEIIDELLRELGTKGEL